MAEAEIIVGCQYLRNLANDTRRTASDLRRFARLAECRLTSAPVVEKAYGNLSNKWDERREKLAEALDGVASSFDTASEEFTRVDSELAGTLEAD